MTDMEIACNRSPVRTAILLVQLHEAFIRKLLAVDVRPSGRKQERFLVKILEFWSYSWPFGRPMTTVRTVPIFVIPDAHLSPQPINRGLSA
jgi:hypothetical protein